MKASLLGTLCITMTALACSCAVDEYGDVDERDSADQLASASQAIVGGTEAAPNSRPWQALLVRDGSFICGGSLIGHEWVLTAAHCVSGVSASRLRVVLGEHKRSVPEGKEQLLTVASVHVHEAYTSAFKGNDIALLRIVSATLNDAVAPVALPTPDVNTDTGSSLVSGWGRIAASSATSDVLREAHLPLVSNATCQLSNSLPLTDTMLCAGDPNGTSGGACNGDSGGPLVQQGSSGAFTLIGAPSFVKGGCSSYTMFARVQSFIDWINTVMHQAHGSHPDSYVSGNFDGAPGDELLAVNPNGWHHTMRFDGSSWQYVEGAATGSIGRWRIAPSDRFLSGDFDGDGRDELLAINPDGRHHTMRFNGASWQFVEGGGEGTIYWWHIGEADKYVVGDFDGDHRDELLAINPNGWHHTMRFDGASWRFIEGGGEGTIYWWHIGAADKYVAGDFDGDGRDDLLAVNPNGWHHTMRFDGSSWKFLEGDGEGAIYWWHIGADDKYQSGDFNGDGRDDLLAVNPNGWHHTMRFDGSSWKFVEGGGEGTLYWWHIGANDRYVSGDFDGNAGSDLLAINPNGWHHTMRFNGTSSLFTEGDGSGKLRWWPIR